MKQPVVNYQNTPNQRHCATLKPNRTESLRGVMERKRKNNAATCCERTQSHKKVVVNYRNAAKRPVPNYQNVIKQPVVFLVLEG